MMIGLACFAFGIWDFTPITHDWGWHQLSPSIPRLPTHFAVAPAVTLTLGGFSTIAPILNFLRLAKHLNASNPRCSIWCNESRPPTL